MLIPEKTWRDLTASEIDHFFPLCKDRAEKLGTLADSIGREFAKYLFAANAGAAGGLFLLPNSDGERLYLWAFSTFCFGVFWTGCAWFASWSSTVDLSTGWTSDFNALMRNEITFGELDARNSRRHRSAKRKLAKTFQILSFCFLIIGGLIAANAFWRIPPASHVLPERSASAFDR